MRELVPGSLVLITGGAGFVGSVTAQRLLARGLRVRVLDDLSQGRRERLANLEVDFVEGDVRSERILKEALVDVTAVVHLATARPSPTRGREERLAHEVNVTGTLGLCHAASAMPLAHFVFASSRAVYGKAVPYLLHENHPLCPFTLEGVQKLAAENYVRLFAARDQLPATIVRLFSVYGPGQDCEARDAPFVAKFVGQAACGQPVTIHGDGTQTRDLLHVDDAARAIENVLGIPGPPGRTFNVASGQSVAVRHVAAMLSDLVEGLPSPKYSTALHSVDDPHDVRVSVSAAASALGFSARVGLREGLTAWLERCLPTGKGRPPSPPSAPLSAKVPLFSDRPPSWAARQDRRSSTPIALTDSDLAEGDVIEVPS